MILKEYGGNKMEETTNTINFDKKMEIIIKCFDIVKKGYTGNIIDDGDNFEPELKKFKRSFLHDEVVWDFVWKVVDILKNNIVVTKKVATNKITPQEFYHHMFTY